MCACVGLCVRACTHVCMRVRFARMCAHVCACMREYQAVANLCLEQTVDEESKDHLKITDGSQTTANKTEVVDHYIARHHSILIDENHVFPSM